MSQKSPALRALHSSASAEWYTPARYVEAARALMGEIECDPASCVAAQRVVKARTFYTRTEDGLRQPWHGRVWLNPPYGLGADGVSNQERWSHSLLARYIRGEVTEAVLLVNAATGAGWFQPFYHFSVCLVQGRIRFQTPTGGGRPQQPTQENAFVFLAPHARHGAFVDHFSQFGWIGTFERRRDITPPLPFDCGERTF